MDKSKIAVIGTGGCGNALLNTLMDCEPRYTPIFCNTNLAEMESLDHYKSRVNSFYIAGASGAGKKLDLARELIINDQARMADYFSTKFSTNSGITDFWIMSSGAGASGNASVKIITRMIKTFNPSATVNLLIAAPSVNEGGKSFYNFMSLSDDIASLYNEGLLNSYMFIDNNKASRYDSMEEFNEATMQEFDDSLSITYGGVDFEDSKNTNTAIGYKVILPLKGYNNNIGSAIDYAIKNSNFVMPDDMTNCGFIAGLLNKEVYSEEYLRDNFNIEHDIKIADSGDDYNILVLGGCSAPDTFMRAADELCAKYVDNQNKGTSFQSYKSTSSRKINTPNNNSNFTSFTRDKKETKERKSSRMTKNDLKKLMADENFWK